MTNFPTTDLSKFKILIPARYASTRFPGKPLKEVNGKSIISLVYENCAQTGIESFVVTDDDRIQDHVQKFGGNVLRVDDDVLTGSERIGLAVTRYFGDINCEYIINVQGDEPLLACEEILKLAAFHIKSDYSICTLVKKMKSIDQDFKDPNRVKVFFSENLGQCHFFSRAPIPFIRDVNDMQNAYWFLHIGVYSYKKNDLLTLLNTTPSYYEKMEKLEQLRALDLGMKIGAVETLRVLIGVDTPEDLKKLEEYFNGK